MAGPGRARAPAAAAGPCRRRRLAALPGSTASPASPPCTPAAAGAAPGSRSARSWHPGDPRPPRPRPAPPPRGSRSARPSPWRAGDERGGGLEGTRSPLHPPPWVFSPPKGLHSRRDVRHPPRSPRHPWVPPPQGAAPVPAQRGPFNAAARLGTSGTWHAAAALVDWWVSPFPLPRGSTGSEAEVSVVTAAKMAATLRIQSDWSRALRWERSLSFPLSLIRSLSRSRPLLLSAARTRARPG